MNTIASSFPSETLLWDYYRNVYCRLRLQGRSADTFRQYEVMLRHLERFLERSPTLADLEDDIITAFLGSLLGRGLNPVSSNKTRDHLLALWRYAARKRHVECFPDVRALPVYKRAPSAWTMIELQKLINAAQSLPSMKKPIAGIPAGIWWTALILFLYDTGARIGAALQVQYSDVNFDTGRVLLRAETQKQKADQILPLHSQTLATLKLAADVERELLFPWPYCPSYLWPRFKKLLKAAGLPHGRRDKFHRIRRTTATQAELHAGRGSATSHLGHSTAKMTELYIDRSMLPESQIAQLIPRLTMGEAMSDHPPAEAFAVMLPDALVGFQASYCWSGLNGGRRRRTAVSRLRIMFEACRMTTAADLASTPIKDYLRSLLASGSASKTVRDYGQDVCMFVRWLAKQKLPREWREIGRIITMDTQGMINRHEAEGGTP